MRKHRSGNDLAVVWSILSNGESFLLEGREWKLYLKNLYGSKEITDFSVNGNKIYWTFWGKDQKSLGKYTLTLVGNEGAKGMITIDTCDFVCLVARSCEVGGADSINVEVETIELESYVQLGPSDNADNVGSAVKYEPQNLSESQKAQARANIGAASTEELQRMYNELLALIQGGVVTPSYAILDQAILDQAVLS